MEKKLLTLFQQSELNGVVMYQALAEEAASPEEKKLLLQLGAVEGKHAAILRAITGVNDLRPTNAMKTPVLLMEKLIGRKATFTVMAVGELGATYLYLPLAQKYETLKTVATEETEHGKTLLALAKALRGNLPIPGIIKVSA